MYPVITMRAGSGSVIGRAVRSTCILGAIFLSTGSLGATATAERMYYSKGREASSQIAGARAQQAAKIDVRSARQHLDNIKNAFSLPISDVSRVVGVSRQSVYKWMSESASPEGDNLARLEALSRLADRFLESGVSRAGALLSVKVSDEKSLLDLFAAGSSVDEYIPQLIAEAVASENAYANSAIRSKKAAGEGDWKSSVSIPFSNEA